LAMGCLGKMTPAESKLLMVRLVSLAGFTSLNTGLNFYNSWLLKPDTEVKVNVSLTPAVSAEGAQQLLAGYGTGVGTVSTTVLEGGPGFTFPVFYTMWHMVASVLGCTVIMCFRRPETGWPSLSQLIAYFPSLLAIAICTTANIGCNNASLTLVSLFLNQVIKAIGPLPTMIFAAIFQGKRYSWPIICCTGVIVGGTILAVPMSSKQSTSFTGVIVVVISMLAASLKPVIMSIVMKGTAEHPKLPSTVVLFYDTFLSFWMMLVYWLASAERERSVTYIGERPGTAIGLILGGASMAFGFNLSNYVFCQVTDPVTLSVASNGVKVVNLVISAIIDNLSDPRNWTGVSIVCVAIFTYAYLNFQAAAKAKAQADATKEIEKGLMNEGTPLKGDDLPSGSMQCCVIL